MTRLPSQVKMLIEREQDIGRVRFRRLDQTGGESRIVNSYIFGHNTNFGQ